MSTRWTREDLARKGLKVTGNQALKEVKKIIKQPASFALGRMKAGKMNKTEAAYANYLETLKFTGDVLWYEFEPVNLRLADKCFYAVDFMVMLKSGQLECHEVKGYWTDDALVKIKAAAEKFPFKFLSKRLIKGEWETREF